MHIVSIVSQSFLVRQHLCLAHYMVSPVRPSVCLSGGCITEKRLKLGL